MSNDKANRQKTESQKRLIKPLKINLESRPSTTQPPLKKRSKMERSTIKNQSKNRSQKRKTGNRKPTIKQALTSRKTP